MDFEPGHSGDTLAGDPGSSSASRPGFTLDRLPSPDERSSGCSHGALHPSKKEARTARIQPPTLQLLGSAGTLFGISIGSSVSPPAGSRMSLSSMEPSLSPSVGWRASMAFVSISPQIGVVIPSSVDLRISSELSMWSSIWCFVSSDIVPFDRREELTVKAELVADQARRHHSIERYFQIALASKLTPFSHVVG
jgi:hypothetical protein